MLKLYEATTRLSLVTFFVFLLNPAFAQNKVWLGVKAGINLSKTNQSEYYNYNDAVRYGHDPAREPGVYKSPVQFGYNPNREFGLVVNMGNDTLSFQPELLFVQKGFKAYGVYESEGGRQNKNSYEQWQNTYVEIPLLAKLALGTEKLKFFVAAGPSIGFWQDSYYNRNVTGKEAVKNPYNFESQFLYTIGSPKEDTITHEMKRVGAGQDSVSTVENRREISAVFATGLHYKLRRSLFIVDIRYVTGLTDLYRYNYGERPLYTDKLTNRRIAFSVSYLFSFKE